MAAFFDNGSMERGMVMQTYRGKSVFGGVAVGKICVYQKGEQTVKRTKIENTEQEKSADLSGSSGVHPPARRVV